MVRVTAQWPERKEQAARFVALAKAWDGFPLPALGIGEETGFEIFYNIHLLPGLTLTADFQYIDTGLGVGPLVTEEPDDAWVGGLRLRLVL